MQEWFTVWLQNYGYIALFVLMFLESAFLVIPSETIMVFTGFLVYKQVLSLFIAVAIAALGNVCGSLVLYGLAVKLDKRFTHWLSRFVSIKKIQQVEEYFRQKSYISVFFAQFIPGIRTLISLPSGWFNLSLKKFIPLTYLGAFLWNLIWIGTSYLMGPAIDKSLEIIVKYQHISITVVVVITIVLAIAYYVKPSFFHKIIRKVLGI